MSRRLSREGLHELGLPEFVDLPQYDLCTRSSEVPRKWLQIGTGAFAKGFVLEYADRLRHKYPEWAVRGISTQNNLNSRERLYRLKDQGKVWVVVKRINGHSKYRVCAPLTKVTWGPERFYQIADDLADPRVNLVTFTIRGKGPDGDGYHQVPGASEVTLDIQNTAVAHDLMLSLHDPDINPKRPVLSRNEIPETVFGYLAQGLAYRKAFGGGPLTMAPCDNMEDNGHILRETLLQFLLKSRGRYIDLAEWVASQVAFCGTSVDRRVAADSTRELLSEASAKLGVTVTVAVEAESFSDWVMEASPYPMPPLAEVGVHIVDNIRPYQDRKIFHVNGAHQVAIPALRMGHVYLDEALAETHRGRRPLAELLERYHGESARYLGPAVTPAYGMAIRERFTNTGLKDPVPRIVRQTTLTKVDPRLLAGVERYLEATDGKHVPPAILFLVATWLTNLCGTDEMNRELFLNDEAASGLKDVAIQLRDDWLVPMATGRRDETDEDDEVEPNPEKNNGQEEPSLELELAPLADDQLQPLRWAMAKIGEIIGSDRFVRMAANDLVMHELAWSMRALQAFASRGGPNNTFDAILALLDRNHAFVEALS